MRQSPYLAALLIMFGARASLAADSVPIETIAVADGIHMLVGRGGNVAVATGPDGTFVIDDQYAEQFAGIERAIAALSAQPVKFLVNTHWHGDHTGGNAQMGKLGAVIVAHENVRSRLSSDQAIEFFHSETPASPAIALPIVTFTSDITFHLNGGVIEVFHVDRAHTDGDAVVHFRDANVIHTGDVFFNGMYPFIDSGTGGSITGVIAAVEKILALANDETRLIPGHGPLGRTRDLKKYLEMLRATRQAVASLIVGGSTEEQAVLAHPTASFDPVWGGGFIKPDVYVRMIYNDLKRETLE